MSDQDDSAYGDDDDLAAPLPAEERVVVEEDEEQILITKEGLRKLKEELVDLKTVKRKQVGERLKEAISYGDLSENAEYEEAKNEQAFVEGRILEPVRQGVLVLPCSTIDEDGTVQTRKGEKRKVVCGVRDGFRVEICSGLEEGEEVGRRE